jgi:L-amino acid N-acyltransferase
LLLLYQIYYMMEIRKYKTEDANAILEIINYNIINSTALYDYHPRSLENQIAIFDDKLKKNFPIIVAIENEQVFGFGYYSEFRFREAYQFTIEHSVYVDENFHGKGIGKLLMERLINLAEKQGFHTMIGVIDSENTNSIAFHEQFGFEKVGLIKDSGFKFDRWLHSVFMQKMLKKKSNIKLMNWNFFLFNFYAFTQTIITGIPIEDKVENFNSVAVRFKIFSCFV